MMPTKRNKQGDTAGPHAPLPSHSLTHEGRPEDVDFSFLRPLKPTVVFTTYWQFAAKRQELFFRRLRNPAPPWTSDPVLKEYKFTNAYRAADRVSQFLIRHVIYAGDPAPEEVFFRILLFKLFNRIDTWQLLESQLSEISFSSFFSLRA